MPKNQFTSENQPSKASREKALRTKAKKAERRKTYKEVFDALLSASYKKKGCKEMVSGVELSAEKIFMRLIETGDIEAFKAIRDTVGEKPVDKVVTADVEASTIAEVEEIFKNG